ncbi:hypothetical protein BDZ91DRAFT_763523 [Kalaharituber pfeilii]|nr:hypothetical protein BDZ91DRAFT_763523 [Kalaharituber pfeilii]
MSRAVYMDWMLGIFRYICSSDNDRTRQKWQKLALAMAATCRLTFDVDLGDLYAVFNSKCDLADFIEWEVRKEYVNNPLYKDCFKSDYFKRTFLVTRADIDMPGMLFQMVHPVHEVYWELKVYFAMRGDQLIIRTKKGSTIHEVIPQEKLTNDFPTFMLTSHIHFLDLNQHILVFRPLNKSEPMVKFQLKLGSFHL